MATYRPKKLDEINDVYGKSVQAKKTIRQTSDMLTGDTAQKAPAKADDTAPAFQGNAVTTAEGISLDSDISDIANDFILRFGTPERAAATTMLRESEAQKAKAKATSVSIKAKVKPVNETVAPALQQPSGDTGEGTTEDTDNDEAQQEIAVAPPTIRKVSSDKTVLMDDYMRVMNDEDDEGPAFRRRKKDKKRKNKKANHAPVIEDNEDTSADDAVSDSIALEDATAAAEDSAAAVSVGDGATETDAKTDGVSPYEEPAADEEGTDSESSDTADDEAHDEEAVSEDTAPVTEKKNSHTGAKVILSLLLVVLIALAGAVGAVKMLIAPDTGTLVSDKYYFFTSDADYTYVGVNKGDLVITEKVLPELNDNFVYADKDTQRFVFAKQQSRLLNLDGDVLYVAESDGERATVFRDDVKGVFYKIVPTVGAILAIIGEYYIILISALLILCFVIILILSLAFKSKKDEDTTEDDIEVDSDEYEDIFSTSSGEKVDLFSEIE